MKSLHFKEFKSALDIEFYLNIGMTYVLRKAFSNFRCSGHKLMIEKGRHLNIERNLRFCPLCQMKNLSVIEDEYHFSLNGRHMKCFVKHISKITGMLIDP